MNKRQIERERIGRKFDWHCAYCGTEINMKSMQVDHQMPKSYSNNLFGIERLNNLYPSCRRCNHYKREDELEQFRQKMKTLHERIMNIYIVKVAINFGIVKIIPFDGKFYFEKLKPTSNENRKR
jgi:5-methylcytosine-specific restriction endonuclease McrA